MIFDLYRPGDAFLHRLDPRVKLLLIGEGIVAAFFLRSPWAVGGWLILLLLFLRLNGLPGEALGWLWRQMRLLGLFILLLQPFFAPSGRLLLTLGPLRLTTGGVEEALYLGDRLFVMAPRPGRIEREYELPFAERGLHVDPREMKASPEFIQRREELLSLIWEMEEQIMGPEAGTL